MQEAKRLHARLITTGLHQHDHHLRKLITLYSSSSSLSHARLLFGAVHQPSTFLYNTLFRAYAASPTPLHAFFLHRHMLRHGPPPDSYTFPFLIKACSAVPCLPKAQELHCQALKTGFCNVFFQNYLIHFYGSNSMLHKARRVFDEMGYRDDASWTTLLSCYVNSCSVEAARKVFDEMPDRSVVSYSAMIAGYVRWNRFMEALKLFREMLRVKIEPSDSCVMGVLCACANLGALDVGRWVYSHVCQRKKGPFDSRIATALIDMFFKCGSREDALQVFEDAKEKNVGEWTAMLTGLALHGLGEQLIMAFEEMIRFGVKPNGVTFTSLLSGCTHSGLINEGLDYFYRMEIDFGVEPSIEHYGCVVDLLGRAGLIDQAMQFISTMPFEPNGAIWGSVLNACRVYKNVEIGEIASQWLIKDEPWNGALYMSLMSLYQETGRSDQVEKVKREMKEVGCRKSPGCSLIEVDGVCHEFVVEDKSNPRAVDACLNLSKMIMEFNWDMGFTTSKGAGPSDESSL